MERIINALPFDLEVKRALEALPAFCVLLYRAQGKKTAAHDHTRSTMGLAILSPDLKVIARHSEPVIAPEFEFENLGVEDGRLSKVGDRYVLLYTAYGYAKPENTIRIALASTRDFVRWEKHGLLKGDLNGVHNKNAMLFEGKTGGKYLMLHRPMQGSYAMAVHWAEADDVFGEWKGRGAILKPLQRAGFVDTWVGGGAPPLLTSGGRHLMLYHLGNRRADGSREYDLGIALLDCTRPDPVVRRHEPLLQPSTEHETLGDPELGVNNVVFVCGAYFWNGDLWFPYAGADSVVLGGKIEGSEVGRFIAG
ncbi:MAG: glycosidase [Bacteroidota bacterium]